MIEFALILPFLLLVLTGIVDASWSVSNQLDLRHASREGARVAAVGAADPAILAATCNAIKPGDLRTNASISMSGGAAVGQPLTLTITSTSDGLTGLIPVFNGIAMSESAVIYMEQDPGFGAGGACP